MTVSALLAAACDRTGTSPSADGSPGLSASARVSLPPERGTCIEFEAPLAVGDQFGAPVGHSSGDVAFNEAGIPVAVLDFLYASGGGTFNYAEVMAAPAGFGLGQVVFMNNISFEFDFTGLGFVPERVELAFLDQGGNENLAVNGDPSPPYAGELTAAPSPLGGVDVTISSSASGAGAATFLGPVERLIIGGQEFSLDHVCAYVERERPGGTCIEFESPLSVGDEFGATAGHSSGDIAFTEAGIPVAVVDFLYDSGGGTFNYAEVMTAPPGFGSGQVVFLNNINFEFDFTGLGFVPQRVELAFLDQGGNENLAVNGDPAPPFAGELTTALSPFGGVDFTVSFSASAAGTATFMGPVERVVIGGQEFSLDHVCAFK